MPRLKRIGRAGFYHVINRGVEKRKVFLDDPDHLRFLHLVDEQKALFGFDIRAYCLMPNHYHLLFEMKDESLSLVTTSANTPGSDPASQLHTRLQKVKLAVDHRNNAGNSFVF